MLKDVDKQCQRLSNHGGINAIRNVQADGMLLAKMLLSDVGSNPGGLYKGICCMSFDGKGRLWVLHSNSGELGYEQWQKGPLCCFVDGETTESHGRYDLQGRRIENGDAGKGICIENGRLIIRR